MKKRRVTYLKFNVYGHNIKLVHKETHILYQNIFTTVQNKRLSFIFVVKRTSNTRM